jgi:alpha-tubulin suppressor-like RCC1 family protein
MRYGLICLALATSACSLKADYSGTLYQCDPNGECPDQFACIENRCVPTDPPASECTNAVTAGREHACAIRSDGTAWCWGRNDYGQLGDGTNTDRTAPVMVSGTKLPKFTAIASGNNHSCAVGADGTVWC